MFLLVIANHIAPCRQYPPHYEHLEEDKRLEPRNLDERNYWGGDGPYGGCNDIVVDSAAMTFPSPFVCMIRSCSLLLEWVSFTPLQQIASPG